MDNRAYETNTGSIVNMSDDKINVVPIEYVNKRFDGIERKLDVLSQAMIDLARTEEKIMSLEKERQQVQERLNAQSQRIDQLSDLAKENTRVTNNVSKISWIIVTVVVGIVANILFMG